MLRRLSRSQHPHEVARRASELAGRAAADPTFRLDVMGAILPLLPAQHVQDGSDWPEALHRFARSCRHVREPGHFGELLLHPRRVIQFRAGDCDCIATCIAAMAAHVGLDAGVCAIWTGPNSAHAVAVVGDRWYGGTRRMWVVDPDQPQLIALESSRYRLGRLFRVRLPRRLSA